jgi:hypothetical protein
VGGLIMRQRWRAVAQWAVVLGGLGVLAWQLPTLGQETNRLGEELAHLRWGWVAAAAALGVGALVLYGELHRRLLAAGGARLSVRTVQAINFAENALSTTLPAVGNAAGFVYATYQLRKRGVDVALAAWSLVLAGMVATITLLVLGLLGLSWAGQVSPFIGVPAAIGVALGAWGSWVAVTRPAVLHRWLRGIAWVGLRMPPLCRTCRRAWATDPEAVVRRTSDRIRLLRPTPSRWMIIIVVAALSWASDFLSLLASIGALGHPVPWAVLVAGFLVVQGSIALQVFPGGAGLAEAGLLGVLLAAGTPIASALAGVLIYRTITWLGLAALGWVVYAVQIHASPLYDHTHAPEAPSGKPRGVRNVLRDLANNHIVR